MTNFADTIFLPQHLLLYLFAYALAATPTSYVVARVVHKKPHASAHAWQAISKKSKMLIFVCDVLKGVIPCAIAQSLQVPVEIIALIGLVAVLGHCFSPWLRFTGGRGAATSAGALFFVYWPASMFGLLVFALLLFLGIGTGSASLIASVVGIGALFLGITNKSVWLIVAIMWSIIVLRHKAFWWSKKKH